MSTLLSIPYAKLRHAILVPLVGALAIATFAGAANADTSVHARSVPAGTLTYQIVVTGSATTRSAAANAAGLKSSREEVGPTGTMTSVLVPMQVPADTEQVRWVVHGSMRMHGAPAMVDPVASAVQQKARMAKIKAQDRKAQKRIVKLEPAEGLTTPGGSTSMQKAAAICKKKYKTQMAQGMCMAQQVNQVATGGGKLSAADQRANAAKAENLKQGMLTRQLRFNVWRAMHPCTMKIQLHGTGKGLSLGASMTSVSATVYHLSTQDAHTADCAAHQKTAHAPPEYTWTPGGFVNTAQGAPPPPADETKTPLITADTVKHTYTIRFPAQAVATTADDTFHWKMYKTNVAKKLTRHHGKKRLHYTVNMPTLTLHGLHLPAAGHALSGTKTIQSAAVVPGAIGVTNLLDKSYVQIHAKMPVKAVVTWTFTPDRH